MPDFYGTVQGYTAYMEARGRFVDPDDEAVQQGLLIASEYVDGRYAATWVNGNTYKTGQRAQVREWPRVGFIDCYGYAIGNDEIPREVENATYEAAARQIAKPGSLRKDFSPSAYKQASVDGAVAVTFNSAATAADVQLQIPEIDAIMYPLVNGPSASVTSSLSGKILRV